MDAPHVFSQPSGNRAGVPVPLDGEIIPPSGRAKSAGGPSAPPVAKAARKSPWGGSILIGVMVAALFGLGAAGGFYFWDRAHALDATVLSLRQVQHELVALKSGVETLKSSPDAARQDETIRTLKKNVDTLKAELEASRSATASANAQLAAKIDKTDHDPSAKLADISARLDKLEGSGPKFGEITARLERIERQVSSPAATGTIAAKSPAQTAVQPVSTPVEKAPAKPGPLENWVLRDVYDGIALVEGRTGGIREVTPGEFLPGAGEVRAIERRGRNWIVVTSRGVIDDSTF